MQFVIAKKKVVLLNVCEGDKIFPPKNQHTKYVRYPHSRTYGTRFTSQIKLKKHSQKTYKNPNHRKNNNNSNTRDAKLA